MRCVVANIDIDQLTQAELMALNERVVARLRLLQQMNAHQQMLDFTVGERVQFQTDRGWVRGTLTKYNRKTVTILSEDGARWNVSPFLLKRVAPKPVNPNEPQGWVVLEG
jgi:hypothetical protein